MTIINVTATDNGLAGTRWKVPPDPELNNTAIPRSLRKYGGTAAIAALGANDETAVNITLTFPTAFVYLCKSINILFQSDDLTTEFGNFGTLEYFPAGGSTLALRKVFAMECAGATMRSAATSVQVFNPIGTWRNWVNGPAGDTIHLRIADVSGDTSTAGDVAWVGEFYEFDVNQCLNWPTNTPQQTLGY